MSRRKIVILTGAGISAESGISTFRDAGGLWEGHDIMEVASPQGWDRNQGLVLDFYNKRRAQLHTVVPNVAHEALAKLDKDFDTYIITQNVDDLHERGGSSQVLHLHGELYKARSVKNPEYIVDWKKDMQLGDTCPDGGQMRPHIVWFGEAVPMLEPAAALASAADVFMVIGTSMQVYPAASLISFVPDHAPKYFIDPHPAIAENAYENLKIIAEKATVGVPPIVNELIQSQNN
ncbi:MAG: Sir2 family NAD-dependent protein deacetylase [Bacteroidota bacterium]